ASAHEQPFAVQRRHGVVGHVDLHEAGVGAQEHLGTVEVDGAPNDVALPTGGRVVHGSYGHIVGFALEDEGGLLERGAPTPFLDQPWVAGAGQRALTEVRADVDAVLVDPAHRAFRLGQGEPVVDELTPFEIELPHYGG